ncbi:MAG: TcpQ domain-containing protein [Rhodospirillales bacterium]|nr:TcpQ domain-containing protein [Rhodospirillales bacterium]
MKRIGTNAAALFFLLIMALAMPVSAQEESLYAPTSAWLVGYSSIFLPDQGGERPVLPCLMSNQYNNGYVFRFSGDEERLYALVVDFRQAVFKPGEKYPVHVMVSPDFDAVLTGAAFDQGTLIINLQDEETIRSVLVDGQILTLGVGDKDIQFALMGMGSAFKRLGRCYREQGVMSESLQRMPAPVAAEAEHILPESKAPPQTPDIKPQVMMSTGPVMDGQGVTPPRIVKQEGIAVTMDPVPAQDIWKAAAGSDLKGVLSAWAVQANARLLWDTDKTFAVLEPVSMTGTFEMAVLLLLEQYQGAGVKNRPVGQIYRDPGNGQKTLWVYVESGHSLNR